MNAKVYQEGVNIKYKCGRIVRRAKHPKQIKWAPCEQKLKIDKTEFLPLSHGLTLANELLAKMATDPPTIIDIVSQKAGESA